MTAPGNGAAHQQPVGVATPREVEVMASLARDPRWQAAEIVRCARDPAYWLAHYVWTWDSERRAWRRFPMYPYLLTIVELHRARWAGELVERVHILGEKPRGVAFSILMALLAQHGLQFVEGWDGFMASYLRRRVDDGGENSTPSSLFGKLRGSYLRQAKFLRDYAPLTFRHGMVTNTRSGATLVAETATDTGARGLHGAEGYIDEIGYVPHLEQLLASAEAATRFMMIGGTPNGEGTRFHAMSQEADKGQGGYRKVEIEFWHVPERRACRNCGSVRLLASGEDGLRTDVEEALIAHDRPDCAAVDGLHFDHLRGRESSPWLNDRGRSYTEPMLLQEFFRSHRRTRSGLVWPVFGTHRHVSEEFDLKADGWDYICSWDYGVRDMTTIGWAQARGERLEVFDDHETNEVSYEYWCNYYAWTRGEFHAWEQGRADPAACLLRGVADPRTKVSAERSFERQWGAPGRYRDLPHVTHVGDPSGRQVDSSFGSWEANLRKGAAWDLGPDRGGVRHFGRIPVVSAYSQISGRVSETEKIQAIEYLLLKDRLGVHPRARNTVAALANYHWPTNRLGQVMTASRAPAHDQFSHSADRLGYLAIFRFGRLGSGTQAGAL